MGDGNCGFRSAAISLGRSSEDWPHIRQEMLKEMDTNPIYQNNKFMFNVWGMTLNEARKRLNHNSGPAPLPFWFSFPSHAFLLADTYKRPVVSFSAQMSATYLPLTSSPTSDPQITPLCLIFIQERAHIVTFKFKSYCWPAPRIHPFWKEYCSKEASTWKDIVQSNLDTGVEVLFPPTRKSSRLNKIVDVE